LFLWFIIVLIVLFSCSSSCFIFRLLFLFESYYFLCRSWIVPESFLSLHWIVVVFKAYSCSEFVVVPDPISRLTLTFWWSIFVRWIFKTVAVNFELSLGYGERAHGWVRPLMRMQSISEDSVLSLSISNIELSFLINDP